MIELEKALAAIQSIPIKRKTEKVPIGDALNRVAAEDIRSDLDIPPFDKAAMDGYACRAADLVHELTVIGEVPAGNWPDFMISNGECARIMTGAPLPKGADCVVMKEHVTVNSNSKIVINRRSTGTNVCYAGEDIKAGRIVVNKGDRLTPAHISMLATVGCLYPEVYCLPCVAVLSTGSELVSPSVKPQPGKIRNSNGYQVAAQLQQYGISSVDLGIAPDDKDELRRILSEAIQKFDITIISGGVSVGDYDYIPQLIEDSESQILFRGLKIKPGKHALLAQHNGHIIMALPGNPVSAFVLFELLIKPLLNHFTAEPSPSRRLLMTLAGNYSTKATDLSVFVPVRINSDGLVEPVDYHGSAHIMAYTMAHGIMEVPRGTGKLDKGEKVYVRPL